MVACLAWIILIFSIHVDGIGEGAVEPLDVMNLKMAVFSGDTGYTSDYNIAFPLFQDTDVVANDLCSTYLHYTDDRLTKCIIGIDQTVKNGKIQRLHQMIKIFFKVPFNDAELFPLTYAYDFPSFDPKSVCIFGYPEYSALLLAVTTQNVRNVHIFGRFADRFVQSVPLSHAYEMSSLFKTKLVMHFADELEDRLSVFLQTHIVCDVVHIANNASEKEAAKIVAAVHMHEGSRAASEGVRIVWTRLWNHTNHHHSFSNREASVLSLPENRAFEVNWLMSSLWPQPSSVMEYFDPYGFSARGFTLFPDAPLMQVHIGRLQERRQCEGQQCFDTSDTKETVIVITYTIRVFADTAFGLQSALRKIGYTHVHVMNMNFASVLALQKEQSDRELLQIAIGPHDLTMLLRRYVVFQMEQLWSVIGATTEKGTRYSALLQGAVGILTFSEHHASILLELGYKHVYNIPIYTRTTDTTDKDGSESRYLEDDDESIDILFFGSCSQRRVDTINGLIQQMNQYNKQHPTEKVVMDYYCGGWNRTLFDEQLSFRVLKSKIILNVHNDANSVLEVHRINYLLSKGRVVASERSYDPLLDAQYEDSVYFIESVEESLLAKSLLDLLKMVDVRRTLKMKALEKHREIQNDVATLATGMNSIIRTMCKD